MGSWKIAGWELHVWGWRVEFFFCCLIVFIIDIGFLPTPFLLSLLLSCVQVQACVRACVHVCCMLKHRGQWLILDVFLNHLPSHFLWQGLSVNLELRTLSLLTSEFQGSTCLLPPSRSNRVTGSHHHANMGSRDLRGSPHARTDCRQFTDWAVCPGGYKFIN